jgi:hypothetical protein
MNLNKRRQQNVTNALAPTIFSSGVGEVVGSNAAAHVISYWSNREAGTRKAGAQSTELNITEQRVLVLVSLHFYARREL